MIPVHPLNVTPGMFIKFRGHGVRDADYLCWWKVTDVSGGVIHAMDRTGSTGRWTIGQLRDLNRRVLAWEPGDDKSDEDPSVLDDWKAATGRR
jgi:hypothetical protein